MPAVDHPFHAILYRCNPVESRPNSLFSCRKNRLHTQPISLQERNLLTEERINFFLYFFFFSLSIHSNRLIGHVNDSRDAEKGLLKYDNLPRRLPEPCLYIYIYNIKVLKGI